VLLLPPAPAARVLDGRVLATLSALSAAAFLRIAVAGPPGGFGEIGRAVVVADDDGVLRGDEADILAEVLRWLGEQKGYGVWVEQ